MGKSAVRMHGECSMSGGDGAALRSADYCVSTVGLHEPTIRQYLREQKELESSSGRA
jgi:REP element-mobilizing transposase RayT